MNKFITSIIVVLLAACAQQSSANDGQDITLNRLDLSELSKVQRESKVFPLERRCEMFEEKLRSMLGDTGSNRFKLFEQVAGVLALRKLPFNNDQPFLTALKQCVDELPKSAAPADSGVRREVIAPPSPIHGPAVIPPEVVVPPSPLAHSMDEFNEVKKNIKDFGQDIYSPSGRTSSGGHKSVYDLDDEYSSNDAHSNNDHIAHHNDDDDGDNDVDSGHHDHDDEGHDEVGDLHDELHYNKPTEAPGRVLTAQDIVQLKIAHRLVPHSLDSGCGLFEKKLRVIFGEPDINKSELFQQALVAVAAREPALAISINNCLEDAEGKHSQGHSSSGSHADSQNKHHESVDQHSAEQSGDNFHHENVVTDGLSKYHRTSVSGNSNGHPRAFNQPQRSAMIAEFINDEIFDEAVRNERNPVRKLEMLLENEKKLTKWLRKQLDDGQYEVAELREKLNQLQVSLNEGSNILDSKISSIRGHLSHDDDPIGRARFDEVKRLYDESVAREAKTGEELKLALARIAQLVSEAKHHDNSDHDNDDDDDDDHHDHKDNHKKDKKQIEDPVKMAHKLQDKFKSSESLANRCQKYYMLFTFTGDVNKQVIKTIARLSLPESGVTSSAIYHDTLRHYADLLARSGVKKAREATQELAQCARLQPSEQYSSGPQQVPVHFVNSSPGSMYHQQAGVASAAASAAASAGPGHSWSYSSARSSSGGPPKYRQLPRIPPMNSFQ